MSKASEAAKAFRKNQKKTGTADTTVVDELAERTAHHQTRIAFGPVEQWTAWEFSDESRLLLHHGTGKIRVPQNRRDMDIAHSALRKAGLTQENTT